MQRNLHLMILAVLLISGCASLPNRFEAAPPGQTKAVVFDIDGTLTPTPFRYWQVREDAVAAVRHFADQGFRIFYVTARVTWLQSQIPGWLEDHGFPQGDLYVTQSSEDRNDHAQFKVRILQRLMADGWRIEWAFGDSTSDFVAYDAVAIAKAQVFALQREGDDECQPGVWAACLEGWGEFLHSLPGAGRTPPLSPSATPHP